jgi:hypothetical protein
MPPLTHPNASIAVSPSLPAARASTLRGLGAALLLAIAPCAARAEVIALQWDRGHFERRIEIAAGSFVELCDTLAPALKVRWRFVAAAPVDFNVHYHEGESVRFPARQDAVARSSGVLDAETRQDYCWMWSNKGPSPIAIEVRLAIE